MAENTEGMSLKDVYEIAWDLTTFESGIKSISSKYDQMLGTIGKSTANINNVFKSMNNVISGSSGNTFDKMEEKFKDLLSSIKQLDNMGSKFATGAFLGGIQQMGNQIESNKKKLQDFIVQTKMALKYSSEKLDPKSKMEYTAQLQKSITLLKELTAEEKIFRENLKMASDVDFSKSIKNANIATTQLQKNIESTVLKMKENLGNIKFNKISDLSSVDKSQTQLNQAQRMYSSLEKMLVSYYKKIESLEEEKNKVLLERAKTADTSRKAMLKKYYDELSAKIVELQGKEQGLRSSIPKASIFSGKQEEINRAAQANNILKEMNNLEKEALKTMQLISRINISKTIEEADKETRNLRKNLDSILEKMHGSLGGIKFTSLSDVHSIGDNQKRLNQAQKFYSDFQNIVEKHGKEIENLEKVRDKISIERMKTTDSIKEGLLNKYYEEVTAKINELKLKQQQIRNAAPSSMNMKGIFGSKQEEINNFSQGFFQKATTGAATDVEAQLKQMRDLLLELQKQSKSTSKGNVEDIEKMRDKILGLSGAYKANKESIITALRDIRAQGRAGFISPEDYEKARIELEHILSLYHKNEQAVRAMAAAANASTKEMAKVADKGAFRQFSDSLRSIRWQLVTFVYLGALIKQSFTSAFIDPIKKVEEFRQSVYKVTAELGMYSAIGLEKSFDHVWNYSYQMLERLRDASTQSMASFEDLEKITKVFAQRGIFPKDGQDFKYIATIGTAVKVLTEGSTASGFKMTKEIRDVVMGIQKPTDYLQQSFLMMGIDLRKTLEEAKKNGVPILKALGEALSPYAEINNRISHELSTQEKRLGNIWDKIKQIALEPIIADMASSFEKFTNTIQTVGGDLTDRGNAIVSMMNSVYGMVKDIVFSIGSIITSVVGAISGQGQYLYNAFVSAWKGIDIGKQKGDSFISTCKGIGIAAKTIGDFFTSASDAVHKFFSINENSSLIEILIPAFKALGDVFASSFMEGVSYGLDRLILGKSIADWFVKQKDTERELENSFYLHALEIQHDPGYKKTRANAIPMADYVQNILNTPQSKETSEESSKVSKEKSKFSDEVDYMNKNMLHGVASEDFIKLSSRFDEIVNKSKVGLEKINAVHDSAMEKLKSSAKETIWNINMMKGVIEGIKAKGGTEKDLAPAEAKLKFLENTKKQIEDMKNAFNNEQKKDTQKFETSVKEQQLSAQKLMDTMGGKYLDPATKSLQKYNERLKEIEIEEQRLIELTGKGWGLEEKNNKIYAAQAEQKRNEAIGYQEETVRMDKYREQLLGGVEGEVNKAIDKFRKLKSDIQLQLMKAEISPEHANQMNAWADQAKVIEVAKAQADQQKHLNEILLDTSTAYADLLGTSNNYYDKQNAELIKLGVSWQQYQEKIKSAELETIKIYGVNSDQAMQAMKLLQNQMFMQQQVVQEKMIEIMNPFFTSLKEMTKKWGDQISDTLSNIITGTGYDRTKFRSRMDWMKQEFAKTLQDMNKEMINSFIKKAVMDPLMGSFGGKSAPGSGASSVMNPLGFAQGLTGGKGSNPINNLTPIGGGLPVYIMGAASTTADSIYKTPTNDANMLGMPANTTQMIGSSNTNSSENSDQVNAMLTAIKMNEGGNYTAHGANGEYGAYQMLPATFNSWAKQAGLGSNIPMTQENQDAVARWRITDWTNKGYFPEQELAGWNTGNPYANWKNMVGRNSQGIPYNVPAYVNKGMGNYNNLLGNSSGNSLSNNNSVLGYDSYNSTNLIGNNSLYPDISEDALITGKNSLSNITGTPLANLNAIPAISTSNLNNSGLVSTGLLGGSGTPVSVTNWPDTLTSNFSNISSINGNAGSNTLIGNNNSNTGNNLGLAPVGAALGMASSAGLFGQGPRPLGGIGTGQPNGTPPTQPNIGGVLINGGNLLSMFGKGSNSSGSGSFGFGSLSGIGNSLMNGIKTILSAPMSILSKLFGGGSSSSTDNIIPSNMDPLGIGTGGIFDPLSSGVGDFNPFSLADPNAIPSINAGASLLSSNAGSLGDVGSMSNLTSGALSMWGDFGFASGGWLEEPVAGVGLNSGKKYTFAENGRELISPQSQVGNDNSTTHLHMPINIDAIDTQSGVAFLQKHSAVIQSQMISAINSNKKIRNSIKTATY